MKRFVKRCLFFIGLLVAGLMIYAHTLLGFNYEAIWKKKFTNENRPTPFKIKLKHRNLYGVDSSLLENKKIPLVFIHGSPGSWQAWETYLKDSRLSKIYRLIAVDRPGFGFSGLGKPERSLSQQAADIAVVFKRFDVEQKVILVGHSYGGPVVARLAADYPDKVAALVILAGSMDPALEKTLFIQKLAHNPFLSWLVPPFAYSTNEEILALPQELSTLKKDLLSIKVPVVVIHGTNDTLVPFENVAYMKQHLTNAPLEIITLSEGSHFIPWENYNLVQQQLIKLSQKIEKYSL